MSGFTFKQFHIAHDHCAMKVGTDGIMLGAWADIKQARTALDIGTGSGLIALMLKQRNPALKVTAVEVDKAAYVQAKENFKASPFSNITLEHADITKAHFSLLFDVIVSNPPYFNDSLQSNNRRRMRARHTDGLTFTSLTKKVESLLSKDGYFFVVIPTTEADLFVDAAAQANLIVAKQLMVKTTIRNTAKRVLLGFTHASMSPARCEKAELTIHDEQGGYSPAYKKLCKDFYLNF